MAATETSVQQLKINKLTQAQYEGITTPSATELYFVTDGTLSFDDLTDKPSLSDLATTTEQAVLTSGITAAKVAQITTNQSNITTINSKIPSVATSSNQLADKAFVNSSINAIAAYYITSDTSGDAFATHAALITGPYYFDGAIRTPTTNDYAIVLTDETHNNQTTRYTYTGTQWAFQYVVNETPMTQAQVNAINSGITTSKVNEYDAHTSNTVIHVTSTDKSTWNAKQAAITGAATTITSSNLTASRALISNTNGKVAASSVTSTELGYVSGVTSAIQTQLNNKQATLVSGTNIKSVNGTTLLGSGDLSTYPAQSGNSGKFLTTNGSAVSWATVDALPAQSGQSGKYLTTNGSTASWANVPTEIPSQTGNSGKFLTTNGSAVSWATVDALPSQTGNSGKFLTTNGTSASWAEISEYTAAEVETLWNSL